MVKTMYITDLRYLDKKLTDIWPTRILLLSIRDPRY